MLNNYELKTISQLLMGYKKKLKYLPVLNSFSNDHVYVTHSPSIGRELGL